jgi:hypothetical protein
MALGKVHQRGLVHQDISALGCDVLSLNRPSGSG